MGVQADELQPPPLTEEERRRIKRTPQLVLAFAGVVIVVSVVVGAVVGISNRHRRPGHHGHPALAIGIGVGSIAVYLVVMWAVMRFVYRRDRYQQVLRYSWKRRRRVMKALRKNTLVAPEDLPVAAALMNMMAKQRWLLLLYPALGLVWAVVAVISKGAHRIEPIILVLIFLGGWPLIYRMRMITLRNWESIRAKSSGTSASSD